MTRSLRVAIPLALILASFLIFIACNTEQANQNRSVTNSGNQTESTAAMTTEAGPPCSTSGQAADRVKALKDHFRLNGTGDLDLERQRANGYYKVDFVEQGELVVMKVQGKVYADGPDGPGTNPPRSSKLKHLIQALEGYLKKGCADLASFEKLAVTATESGFEWVVCESPQEPCGGGRCAMPGQCKMNGNSNTGNVVNGNTSLHPIANSETNANSTSNRKSNSTSP